MFDWGTQIMSLHTMSGVVHVNHEAKHIDRGVKPSAEYFADDISAVPFSASSHNWGLHVVASSIRDKLIDWAMIMWHDVDLFAGRCLLRLPWGFFLPISEAFPELAQHGHPIHLHIRFFVRSKTDFSRNVTCVWSAPYDGRGLPVMKCRACHKNSSGQASCVHFFFSLWLIDTFFAAFIISTLCLALALPWCRFQEWCKRRRRRRKVTVKPFEKGMLRSWDCERVKRGMKVKNIHRISSILLCYCFRISPCGLEAQWSSLFLFRGVELGERTKSTHGFVYRAP